MERIRMRVSLATAARGFHRGAVVTVGVDVDPALAGAWVRDGAAETIGAVPTPPPAPAPAVAGEAGPTAPRARRKKSA
jgi:hypothetical protein